MNVVIVTLLAQAALGAQAILGAPAQQKPGAVPKPSKLPAQAPSKEQAHNSLELPKFPSVGDLPRVEDVMRFTSVSEGSGSASLRTGANASRASAGRVSMDAMIGLSEKLLAGAGMDSSAMDRTSLEAGLFERVGEMSSAPSLTGLSAALGGGLGAPPSLGGAEEAMAAILDPHDPALGGPLSGLTTAQTAFDAYTNKIGEGVSTLRLLTTKLNREVVAANTIKDIISNYKLKFINVLKDIKEKTDRMKQLKSLVQELEKAKLHQGIQDALKTAMTDLNSISAKAVGGHIDAEYEQIQQKLSGLASRMSQFQR